MDAVVGQRDTWGSGKCRELPTELRAAASGQAVVLGMIMLVWQDLGWKHAK